MKFCVHLCDPTRGVHAGRAASLFINQLISVTPYHREAIWRANIRLLSGLMFEWGRFVRIDKTALGHMLNKKDENSRAFLSVGDRIAATGGCMLMLPYAHCLA